MTKVIHKPKGNSFNNKSMGQHECEVISEGHENGYKVFDFICGHWGYETQIVFISEINGL
jgi:hypothetical protein